MLSTNKILNGRYQILSQIGQSKISTVYKARDKKESSAIVELKEMLLDLNDVTDGKQKKTLKSEFEYRAEILTQIRHRAFPGFVECFSENSRQYLVTEFIEGTDLTKLSASRKVPFSLEEIINWSRQMLDALDYLDSFSPPIFLSDLKPQNLKLDLHGQIKLIDFGIVKSGEERAPTAVTSQNFPAQISNYSPFEEIFQLLGQSLREVITQRYDELVKQALENVPSARGAIYSLGAIIYHLSTVLPPPDVLQRTLEVLTKKTDPLRNPHELNPNIPEEISLVLIKALEISPQNRFASPAEMKLALDKAVEQTKGREQAQTVKRNGEFRHAVWFDEHKRLKQEQSENENQRGKREQVSIEAEQNGKTASFESRAEEMNIFKVDSHKANDDYYKAGNQQLFKNQNLSDSLKDSPEIEDLNETETIAAARVSDRTQRLLTENSPLTEKHSVFSVKTSDEIVNLSPASPQNQRRLWVLPVFALILPVIVLTFLMIGGLILRGWFLQTSKKEEFGQAAISETQSNQTVNPSPVSSPEPAGEAMPEKAMPEEVVPETESKQPSTLVSNPIKKTVRRPAEAPKPAASQMKTPAQKPKRTEPSTKKPVTIDDILNEQ